MALACSPHLRQGSGRAPATSLLAAAWKELCEKPVSAAGYVAAHLGTQVDFTQEGLSVPQFQEFFMDALKAAAKTEAIVETGNKYGVSNDFAKMNGELLLGEIKCGTAYQGLSDKDKLRADEFFSLMCLNGDLRNRNILHPNPLDSAVLGNLVNFPKQMFGFPFGAFATNGNESLSLCLYSYRQECSSPKPVVLYVLSKDEPWAGRQGPEPKADDGPGVSKFERQRTASASTDVPDECSDAGSELSSSGTHFEAICLRLGMDFLVVECHNRDIGVSMDRVAVVMTTFSNPSLAGIATWAARARLNMHVHVQDHEFRDAFVANEEPVHFDLPSSIRSMSLQDGVFNTGFQLYRDVRLRDLHCDLPYLWPTAYMSPNEGGSGNSTPLFIDFCFVLLGWSALRDIAMNRVCEADLGLQPVAVGPTDALLALKVPQGPDAFGAIQAWATASMRLPRQDLERGFVEFQRHFVGGKGRQLDAMVTAGGTRSLTVAFESVILRARGALGLHAPLKMITGNPHLAIERAERRLQFQVVRAEREGSLCVQQLKREITDPAVVMVCAQTLSYTDGITDPLPEILEIIESENRLRQSTGALPVTLINDCCLAFSVLVHNDGQNGSRSLRVLDLSEKCITPVIVTLDAHKHLGVDKGISTAIGTSGTLANLSGFVKVGAVPSQGELVRALADMSLVGVEEYHQKYHHLAIAVLDTVKTIEAAGMTIIHSCNRVEGSTVFAVEDPSALMIKKLKKRGHKAAGIYGARPDEPERCQTGFQLSLTPYALRPQKGDKSALDAFNHDVVEVHKAAQASYPALAKRFRENSLLAILLAGGDEELWAFELLRRPGFGRNLVSLVVRRAWSAILDSGVACSDHHSKPLNTVTHKALFIAVLLFVLRMCSRFRKRLVAKRLKY